MSEKMKILEMLQNGQITADEAARLLDAKEPRQNYAPAQQINYRDIADSVTRKIDTMTRDLEPKLYKLTETVASVTESAAQKISKTLETPRHAPSYSSSSRTTTTTTTTTTSRPFTETSFEYAVSGQYGELSLCAVNAPISVKGYNGDKINARVRYIAKAGKSPAISLMKLGDKYYLDYDEDDFDAVGIDAFVPDKFFNNISLSGTNAELSATELAADYITISNANAKTHLTNLSAKYLKAENTNGALRFENITAENGEIENFNASITGSCADIKNLKISGLNGSVSANVAYFDKFSDYTWNVESSNAKLTLNLPTTPTIGYSIQARATLSKIRMGLTGLNYKINDPSTIDAQSANFASASKRVRLTLDVSNAPITVN
ncbi:hypothetical protein AGMMS49975_17530 [Clostridia bacterium]|nr:hypothetical protein AGMMS49975_17530 [Clostridia bacterium]